MRKNKHKLLPIVGLMTLFIVVGSMVIAPLVLSNDHYNNIELVLDDVSFEKQSNKKESQCENMENDRNKQHWTDYIKKERPIEHRKYNDTNIRTQLTDNELFNALTQK